MTKPVRLTAAVIAMNEESAIERVVNSCSFADEVLVVDGGSTDRTIEIAAKLGARVIENPWPGFAAQRNFTIESARGEWVLFIDADEEVTPRLADEILGLVAADPAEDGFLVPRLGLFLGRWMRRGSWGRDRLLRLFRRGRGRVPERAVHETVEVAGAVGMLRGSLLHYAQPDFATIGRKFGDYTPLAARELAARRKRIWAAEIVLRPPVAFFRDYFLRLGFLEGIAGFILAVWGAVSVMAKYAEARRLIKEGGGGREDDGT